MAERRADRIIAGVIALNAGQCLFVVHEAISKALIERYPAFEIIFLRSLFALPVVLAIVWWEQGHLRIRTRRAGALFVRGLLSVGAFGCFLYALGHLGLANAFAIFMSAPLLVAVLAGPVLSEPPTARQWGAVVVGFAAVAFIVRPGGSIPLAGALPMLAAVVFFSLGTLMTRALGRTESASMMTIFVMSTFVLAGAIGAPFAWRPATGPDLGLMAAAGLLAGAAMYCTTFAYRNAPPGIVAPFQYSTIVWATLVGYLVWGDLPDPPTAIAAGVLVSTGIYLIRHERTASRSDD